MLFSTVDLCLGCGGSDLRKACNKLQYKPKNDQKQAFHCVSQVYFCLLTFCLLQTRWCVCCSQKRKTLICKWHQLSLMDLPNRLDPRPHVWHYCCEESAFCASAIYCAAWCFPVSCRAEKNYKYCPFPPLTGLPSTSRSGFSLPDLPSTQMRLGMSDMLCPTRHFSVFADPHCKNQRGNVSVLNYKKNHPSYSLLGSTNATFLR